MTAEGRRVTLLVRALAGEALVTAGLGDHGAAGAMQRGGLRASDADRELVIDSLKIAFVQGRLTRDELAMRAGQALMSRTYAELAAVTDGIPAGLTGVEPPQVSARGRTRRPVNKNAAAWVACAIIPPALGAAFLTYYGGFVVLFLLAFTALTVTSSPHHRT